MLTYKELTSEDRINYRAQLQANYSTTSSQSGNGDFFASLGIILDPTKKITAEKPVSEFVRLSNLKNNLVNEYGFAGIKLIFELQNSETYHQLGQIPAECPWHFLNNQTLLSAIDAIFAPIKNKLPQLISMLKDRIRFIYAERVNSGWNLHYLLAMKLYDNRDYYRIYIGGVPNPAPLKNVSLLKANWSIPQDLQEFYSIHDGFGEVIKRGNRIINQGNSVLSNESIRILGDMMNPICEEQNYTPTGYRFDDLLEFFPDGSGNAQCFIRKGEDINSTVDWDHETREISGEMGFFEFIDTRMSEIDEK